MDRRVEEFSSRLGESTSAMSKPLATFEELSAISGSGRHD